MASGLVIAVDFDGTCVTHEYPYMGTDIGAVPVLKELADAGCRLILYTMRSGKLEKEAVEWFRKNGIPLFAVNQNPEQKKWTAIAETLCRPLYRRQCARLSADDLGDLLPTVCRLGEGQRVARERGLSVTEGLS